MSYLRVFLFIYFNLEKCIVCIFSCICNWNCNFVGGSIIKPFFPAQTSVPNLLDNDNIGEELAGPIQKDELVRLLNNFFRQPEVKAMAIQQGELDNYTNYSAFSRCTS